MYMYMHAYINTPLVHNMDCLQRHTRQYWEQLWPAVSEYAEVEIIIWIMNAITSGQNLIIKHEHASSSKKKKKKKKKRHAMCMQNIYIYLNESNQAQWSVWF